MIKKILIISLCIIVLGAVALITYRFLRPEPEKVLLHPLQQVEARDMPTFVDDMEGERLNYAIQRQLSVLARKREAGTLPWGDETVTQQRIVRTLARFQELLHEEGLDALIKEIPEHFLVFQASGQSNKGDVLFTGYYQPIIEARRQPDEVFRYPLYKPPPDLQVLDLGEINPAYSGEHIALRVEEGKIKPYYDRKALDTQMALAGKGLELYYLRDYLDRYMLHIQGSGILEFENGSSVNVGYAGTNCFPYVSLGKELIRDGVISGAEMSLQAIREHFSHHPEQIAQYMNRNRRYIFFREFSGNVQGSEGVELTAGRSIATDKRLFPGGGLAFIVTSRILRSPGGKAVARTPISRFVLDQDTGSAITGPGRVDIFWGTGERAGEEAGRFKEKGKLYYLLVKD